MSSLLAVSIIIIVTSHTESSPTTLLNSNLRRQPGEEVCDSDVCQQEADLIVSAINATVDPCEDFYGFACGKWILCNPIPDGKRSISPLEKSAGRTISDISAILNTTTCKYEDQNATDKAIIYYKACLKGATTTEKQRFVRRIFEANKLEDWPRTPEEGNASETVEQLFGSLGWESLVLIDIVPDKKNVSRHVLMIDQPNMDFLERDELIHQNDSEIVELNNMYKSIMVKFMMYFKPNITEELAKQLSNDMYHFIVKIAKLTKSYEDIRSTSIERYNKKKLKDLKRSHPNINWVNLLNASLSRVNITVNEEEDIIFQEPEYYEKLMKLLSNVSMTTLYNFLGWSIVSHYGPYASKELRGAIKEFEKKKHGAAPSYPHWRICTQLVRQSMSASVDRLYVQQKFSSQAKEEVEMIAKTIKEEFKKMLKNDDWIDNKTAEEAVRKLDTMILKIGYPGWILNDTALEDHYQFIGRIEEGTPYLEIQEKVKTNAFLKGLQALRQPYDKQNTWLMPATEVNAYYEDTSNTIAFPAGILQSPFYTEGLPSALNYGGIGSAIAHEITHAFDDIGRHFDSTGQLHDWWTKTTKDHFDERAQCFVTQYGSTYDDQANMFLNGNLTLAENIADAGGLKGALKAYQSARKGKIEKTLPNLEKYTGNQLYFIASALSFCENMLPEFLKYIIRNDDHSPPKYRVNIVAQNVEEFAAAFNCPKNSNMVLENRCVMW